MWPIRKRPRFTVHYSAFVPHPNATLPAGCSIRGLPSAAPLLFADSHAQRTRGEAGHDSLLVRNVVLSQGHSHAVLGISPDGFPNFRFKRVCLARTVEFLEHECFGNAMIDFIAIESQSRLRHLDSDCFSFVDHLALLSLSAVKANEDFRDRVLRAGFGRTAVS
jgi:hypothetical protein